MLGRNSVLWLLNKRDNIRRAYNVQNTTTRYKGEKDWSPKSWKSSPSFRLRDGGIHHDQFDLHGVLWRSGTMTKVAPEVSAARRYCRMNHKEWNDLLLLHVRTPMIYDFLLRVHSRTFIQILHESTRRVLDHESNVKHRCRKTMSRTILSNARNRDIGMIGDRDDRVKYLY